MTDTKIRGETIVILANAEWDWSNRVNCHHIATRLAKDNRVLFVDTIGGRTPAPREFRKIFRRLYRIAGGVRRLDENLTVLSPFVVPIYGDESVRALNTILLTWQIRRNLPRGACPILWIFLPSLVGMAKQLGEKLLIYHCIDEHAANPNVPAQQVREWETRLLKMADVVFTSSSTLFQDKRAQNANTFYLPNVADSDLFAHARDTSLTIPDDIRNVQHPIAGFIGNITAYKLDFDLLCAAAQQRPNWNFVLIGPVGRGDPSTDISKLRAQSNVLLLGERVYNDLPRYLKAFDVCLIPFKQNPSTRGTLPMKFFEYLVAGKPVVAIDLPTLAEFREYFYPAHNLDEFVTAIDSAYNEDTSRATARMELARRYSWDARMQEIGAIVNKSLTRE